MAARIVATFNVKNHLRRPKVRWNNQFERYGICDLHSMLNRVMFRALSSIAAKTSGQSIVLGVIILAHAAKVAQELTGRFPRWD